ncbi:hypothetical protein LXL04_031820 [Taraxacum kok-saghyz]
MKSTVFDNNLSFAYADESYLKNGYTDTLIDWIPGMEGTRLRDLPERVLVTDSDDPTYNYMLEAARAADKVSHMIIHTFDELEAALVKELKSIFPNIYTIGPLQLLLNQTTKTESSSSNNYSLWKGKPEYIEWLGSKEPNSVVCVNFGSAVVMSLQDLLEFGWGLVNSNQYFLWIFRTGLVDGGWDVLPLDFMEAVETRGYIGSWRCSREEVLNHPSVGGFLTHGGWGSVIESLSAGVPMLCWPVSHDQRINCRQMCVNWEVGMEIDMNVNKVEVEKLVRSLIDGFEGKQMKKKAMEWMKMAKLATNNLPMKSPTYQQTRYLFLYISICVKCLFYRSRASSNFHLRTTVCVPVSKLLDYQLAERKLGWELTE